jgi:hypothetical protein
MIIEFEKLNFNFDIKKFTQCLRSTSSSASHLRVRNGYFGDMISPSKNVVNVGYSSVRPFIFK